MATYLSAVELERKYEDQGLTAGRVRKWKERGRVRRNAKGYCEEDVLYNLTLYWKIMLRASIKKFDYRGFNDKLMRPSYTRLPWRGVS